MFILVSDVLWILTAKAPDQTSGCILGVAFLASVICLSIYTYAIYAPSQKALLADVKQKVKDAVAKYLNDHSGETPEQLADGLVEVVMAPKENIMVKGEENE